MFDQEFCSFIEYELTRGFAEAANGEARYFWCDGVLMSRPGKEYTTAIIRQQQHVVFTVFTGTTGQEKYDLNLYWQQKPKTAALTDSALRAAVTNALNARKMDVDIKKKTITLLLD